MTLQRLRFSTPDTDEEIEHLARLAPGRLAEYNIKFASSGSFTCTVTLPMSIPNCPSVISSGTRSPSKKAARSAAAEAALSALVSAEVISPLALTEMVTLPGLPAIVQVGHEPEQTWRQRFAAFCLEHGYAPPRYELRRAANTLYSGSVFIPHAAIAGADNLPQGGPLGRVEDVYGQDNAKEALAEQVLPVLERRLQAMLGYA